jgi:hypothetical protein
MDEIQIVCPVKGHEGESVTFKGAGWKYKHLRLWEEANKGARLAEVISERIVGWDLCGEDEKPVAFKAGEDALDDLPPAVASWVVSSFREAYRRAGSADPNG